MQAHFINIRKVFFALIAIIPLHGLIFQFILNDSDRGIIRATLVIVYALNIFIDNFYLRLMALIVSYLGAVAVFYFELF